MVDRNIRINSFHPVAVLTDAVREFEVSEESLSCDDVQLPGQYALWLKQGGCILEGQIRLG